MSRITSPYCLQSRRQSPRFSARRSHATHEFPRLYLKPDPYKNGDSPRRYLAATRVHKHFRLMQMRNDLADIMKKITRHVVSIDNEGTSITLHVKERRVGSRARELC